METLRKKVAGLKMERDLFEGHGLHGQGLTVTCEFVAKYQGARGLAG